MIRDILHGVSKKMMIDFEEITKLIKHPGEKGNSREELLLKYLEQYFPYRYELCKGIIVSALSEQSKQQDIIIFDRLTCPILIGYDSTKFIPVESVYATIEVKSSLNKDELEKSIKNIQSVRKLKHNTINDITMPVFCCIFSYTSSTSLDALLSNLNEFNNELPHNEQIAMVCVLDKGLIVNINKQGLNRIQLLPDENSIFALIEDNENSLMIFYLIILQFMSLRLVTPPNMLAYAGKGEILNTTFSLPKEQVPEDSYYEKGILKVKMSNVDQIVKTQEQFAYINSGKATKIELFNFWKENFVNYITTMGNLDQIGPIDFYGFNCTIEDFTRNILNTTSTNNDFFDKIYNCYMLSSE